MKTARAAAVLALLAGLVSAELQHLDLLRLLMERPPLAGHNRFDRGPSIEDRIDQLWHRKYGEDDSDTGFNEDLSGSSSKRSAVATALNAGRPRRQQAPALGKAVTPFAGVALALTDTDAPSVNAGRPRRQPAALGKAVTPFAGVGILNDMENFFDSLRGNLALQASLSPDERAHFYDPPTVVRPPSSGGSGGSGMRKLHALRPLRPTGNIRSYNRRSLVEDTIYPGANRHDPGLLWAGLGR